MNLIEQIDKIHNNKKMITVSADGVQQHGIRVVGIDIMYDELQEHNRRMSENIARILDQRIAYEVGWINESN